MNLYLLTQSSVTGYNTYDSCVVAAADADGARLIRPDEGGKTWQINGEWPADLSLVTVRLIGDAVAGTEAGVVCASFNAG